ncbi:MAG: hypothetical protein CBB97_00555 [Candidatus Endolissoclinum sp. TMED37]|nr:MAG: hypothetical protein CBB97_00555 [Candidatus Endolissoclinum sp. TMED37]
MSEVIGIKLNAASSTNLGYVHVLAVNHGGQWEQGNSETVPENGQIFVYREFDTEIQDKYEFGEIFQVEANLDDDGRNCKYSARGKDSKNIDRSLGLTTIFETNKTISADNELYFESPLKPVGQVFFITNNADSDKEIVGPFETLSSQLDKIKRAWQVNVRPASEVGSLEPFHIFKAPFELIGAENILKIKNINTADGAVFFGFNISQELSILSAPSTPFIEPKTLLTLLDEALPQNLKLGRRGRREVVAQLEATKKLNPLIKEKGLELLQEFEGREELIQRLANVGEVDLTHPSLPGLSDDADHSALKQELSDLKEQVRDLSTSNQKLNRDYELVSNQLSEARQSGEQENIATLETKIETLEKQISDYQKHENLQKEIDYLERDKQKLQGDKDNLEQLLGELKADISRTDQQFITKAASVLPFLGVLDKVNQETEESASIRTFSEDDFEQTDGTDLLKVLVERLRDLGYVAPNSFLECSTAMAFSSRLVGFYGDPGTGKTTLARSIGHSLNGQKEESSFVSVGKGWSTSADFIGFRNPFADRFDFKNEFFKKYHIDNQVNEQNNQPPDCILFDEASLSSIDSYLSDFMSLADDHKGLEHEKVSVGGEKFYLPSTTRFFLTFNFDENTEALPRKLVDRMPLIHCENVESAERAVIDRDKIFKPICRSKLASMLAKEAELAQDNESAYRDVCDDVFKLWSSLPEIKMIGARRRKQMNLFVQLISNFDKLDEGFISEFYATSFLLPIINGNGDDYASKLSAIAERSHGVKIRYEIQKIIENGQYFGSYKYL